MLTDKQKSEFLNCLKSYKRKYLIKKYEDIDESGTRIMVNYFLTEVLGYAELDEIKTEFRINNAYADYVIQVGSKQHIVVEVKKYGLALTEKFLRQAKGYAADEGIDWILLTNGRQYILNRVIFEKPLKIKEVMNIDLKDIDIKKAAIEIEYLTRKCVDKGHLEKYWHRTQAVSPNNLAMYLYKNEVITALRRSIKRTSNINFSDQDVFDNIHQVVINKLDIEKPKKILK